MRVGDDKAKELIKMRRKFLFPSFLDGDPQWTELLKLKEELDNGKR